MKKLLLSSLAVAGASASLVSAANAQETPAPRQYIVVVAEGATPQLLELGKNYLRKADDDAELNTTFDDLEVAGKVATSANDSIAGLQGVLATAKKNGYKTGLITTGDLTAIAPLFYNLTGDASDAITNAASQYDFLAGAGGEKLTKAGEALKAAKGTYIASVDELDSDISDHVLVTQSGDSFDYAIDRDPETEFSLSELSSLAIDTLGVDNSPFVLVIHDTLIKKALTNHDTPALFEQFREINTILSDSLLRRDDNANLSVAALLTGGSGYPRFKAGTNESNSYFIITNLTRSYASVGKTLKGADLDTINEFINPEDGEYRGWKLSSNDKAAISAGTLDAEAAVRKSYEPVVNLEYATDATTPVSYSVGLDNSNGLVAALNAAVATPAK